MEVDIKTGNVLLADPFMQDTNFKRAVILICEHDPNEGTLGFIINKKLDVHINDIMGDFPEFDSKVYFGGPVGGNTLHYIHNVGNVLDESVEIGKGIFWGGDFEKLKFLIKAELIKPHNIRFFVGYTGWSPGQLGEEINYKSWVTADMHANYIFKSKPKYLWTQVMHNKGDRYSIIAQLPEDGLN